VLGFLFRSTESSKRKTNLLLVLTPYVIRDQNDLRSVFERKMQERQEFLDRYFVFSDEKDYEPPKDYQRLNGLLEDIRQSYLTVDERRRLAESTRPKERKTHEASGPIEMHEQGRLPGGAGGDPGGAAPAGGTPAGGSTPPATRGPRIRAGGAAAPTLLAPGARTSPAAGGDGGGNPAPVAPAPAPRRE
jgi:general secretion pathway protein D